MRLIPLMEAAVAHHARGLVAGARADGRADAARRARQARLRRVGQRRGARGAPYGSGAAGQGAGSASAAEGGAGHGRAAAAGASGGAAAGGALAAGVAATGVAKRRAQSSGALASAAGAEDRASEDAASGSAREATAVADDTATIRAGRRLRWRRSGAGRRTRASAALTRRLPRTASRRPCAQLRVLLASKTSSLPATALTAPNRRRSQRSPAPRETFPRRPDLPALASTVVPDRRAQREPPLRREPLPPTPPTSAGLMAPAAQGAPRGGAPAGGEPAARSAP